LAKNKREKEVYLKNGCTNLISLPDVLHPFTILELKENWTAVIIVAY